jgi:hypothetical protein
VELTTSELEEVGHTHSILLCYRTEFGHNVYQTAIFLSLEFFWSQK